MKLFHVSRNANVDENPPADDFRFGPTAFYLNVILNLALFLKSCVGQAAQAGLVLFLFSPFSEDLCSNKYKPWQRSKVKGYGTDVQ